MRSRELTLPGFVHDVCSAIQPLGANSPFFRSPDLDVEWVQPDAQAAHPLDDGTAVLLERDLDATAERLGEDGDAYRALVGPLAEHWPARRAGADRPAAPVGTFARPTRGGARPASGPQRARGCPVARGGSFTTERARAFFAGASAHSMLLLVRRPSAGFGLSLLVLGHVFGWSFPRGGAQQLTDALVARLVEQGVRVHASSPVDELPDADVVLEDVAPRELLRLAHGRFPERYERALRRYRHGPGVFKLDWALSEPIPWRAPEVGRAATVHLGGTLDELSASEWAA